MIRTNIFGEVPVPGGIPRDPGRLMGLGVSVLDLASNAKSRTSHRLYKGSVTATHSTVKFDQVRWKRRIPQESEFGITDKRKVGAGLLLMAHSRSSNPNISVVQAYVVNDAFPSQGLRRIVNIGLPIDAADFLIEGLESSMAVIEIGGKPNKKQLEDYAKAISTVLPLDT